MQDARSWWKEQHPNVNARALFDVTDTDGNSEISLDEWMALWERTKESGQSDEEIRESLDKILSKKSWVVMTR